MTGEELPVYLASYVLKEYGSGAIMGVPFHDERDCNFALKNSIPIVQVIDGDEENNL
jgi:leucyl-tRNA synthetase